MHFVLLSFGLGLSRPPVTATLGNNFRQVSVTRLLYDNILTLYISYSPSLKYLQDVHVICDVCVDRIYTNHKSSQR